LPVDHELRAQNERQKGYYEARFDAYSERTHDLENASRFTNLGWRMRDRIPEVPQDIGARTAVAELHEQWLGDLSKRAVLDLGCFCGYAKSVPHHFSDLGTLCQELDRLLKPGGIIISDDPLQTEPCNRLARLVYRPFQTRRSIRTFHNRLEIVDMQGVWGVSELALPFSLLPFGRGIIAPLGRWGLRVDHARARLPGPFLYYCRNVTMMLRKRQLGCHAPSGT
jgi:SAM-dependent methyltransferase